MNALFDRSKVGILTFHSAFNEGSILQAFCLNLLIRNRLSVKVEIVDHNYQSRLDFYGSPYQNERTKVLQEYINHLPMSDDAFVDSDSDTFNYINNRYNALFVGSDEIWKVKYPQKRLYPPFPNVYWPSQELHIPSFSYAACIGDTNWNKLPDSFLFHMQKSLNSFDLLSVRDKRTYEFLKWLNVNCVNQVYIMPDPVLSLDISTFVDLKSLKSKLVNFGVDFNKKRIGFYCIQNKVTKKVINYFKKRNVQIIAISDYVGEVDVCLTEKGFTPVEWAYIPKFMSYCISYRMHGCIANIINNTPFIALDLREKPEISGTTKIQDLMDTFDLNDYYWGSNTNEEGEIFQICDFLMEESWPHTKIESIINKKRQLANSFFNKVKNILENK